MASTRFVLLALVVVGGLAALPSGRSAAEQHDDHSGKSAAAAAVMFSPELNRTCLINPFGSKILGCALQTDEKEDYSQNCCDILNARTNVADDCACGILKVIFADENGGPKTKAAACNFTAGIVEERCKKAEEEAEDGREAHNGNKKLIKHSAAIRRFVVQGDVNVGTNAGTNVVGAGADAADVVDADTGTNVVDAAHV